MIIPRKSRADHARLYIGDVTQPGRDGRASIEYVADVSNLGRTLKRDAQKAVDNLDLDTSEITREVAEGFQNGATEATEAFDDIDAHFRRTARSIGRETDDVFDNIGDRARESSDDVQRSFLRPLTNGVSRLGDLLTSTGSAAAGIVISGFNPATLLTVTGYIAAFTLLIPLVIGLGAALADLGGLLTVLPAGLGVLVTSVVTLTVAFNGFGEAIKAVQDGDPEKIAEALKELSPAAAAVVREFEKLLPQFRELGDRVQQSLFRELTGDLTRLANATLPTLSRGLSGVAEEFGELISDFAELAGARRTVEILNKLFLITQQVISDSSGGLLTFFEGLLEAADALGPSFADLALSITNGLGSFGQFLKDAAADGSLKAFFDDAVATVGELFDLVGALGELFGVLFSGTDDAGRGFIETLTDVTKRLTEFFKSAEGQDAIEDFSEIIGAAGIILGFAVNIIRDLIDIFTELDDIVHATGQFFTDLWDSIVEAWNGITSSTSEAADSVGGFFSDLWDDIVRIWDGIVDTIEGAIDSVVTFFQELPGRIVAYLEAIPAYILSLFDDAINNIINVVALGVAAIIVFFTDAPRQIQGVLAAAWQYIVDGFNNTISNIEGFVNSAIEFLRSIPAALQELALSIVQWAVDTWGTVSENTEAGVNKVIEFVSSLPGKFRQFFTEVVTAVGIKGAELIAWAKSLPGKILTALGNVGHTLYDAGSKILQGLIDGIQSKFNQLKEKIASTVQMIRDHLPFSPAKMGPLSGEGSPDRAGAKIAAMIAEGLDTGLPLITGAAGRSAGAVADAGVTPLTATTPGGPAPVLSPVASNVEQNNVFILRIGDEEFELLVERKVEEKVDVEVRRLMAGTRGL